MRRFPRSRLRFSACPSIRAALREIAKISFLISKRVFVFQMLSTTTMTFSEFRDSLKQSTPPSNLKNTLQALWYDAKGDWESAHNVAQEINSREGSWIHAYLHRKEGDLGNASYWYHRANQPVSKTSLVDEWEEITKAMLG